MKFDTCWLLVKTRPRYPTDACLLVFQMFEQNLQVAAQIDGDFKEQVLKLCLKQMNSFLVR